MRGPVVLSILRDRSRRGTRNRGRAIAGATIGAPSASAGGFRREPPRADTLRPPLASIILRSHRSLRGHPAFHGWRQEFRLSDSRRRLSSSPRRLPGEHCASGGLSLTGPSEHPRNAALREQRKDPSVLFPGDKVFILCRQPRSFTVETGRLHRFVYKSPSSDSGSACSRRRRAALRARLLARRRWRYPRRPDEQGRAD